MAVMSDTDRARTVAHYMRQQFGDVAISKSDLRAAINAIDDFLDNNASTINNAFPTAAKNGLTTAQKIIVIGFVAMRRAGQLNTADG